MAEDELNKLIKRFTELAQRADRSGVPQETKFLTMAEQSTLQKLKFPVPYWLFGGYEGAERRIAVFGIDEQTAVEMGYVPPVACVAIAPASKRFAEELTHRDFLGSLMALGINREVLGDIVISGGAGYLFCLDLIADYVTDELASVKRTSVKCSRSELPQTDEKSLEPQSLVVAAERLDAVIAAVYRLPREEAKQLVERGLVYINSRLALKPAASLKEGDIVSVRGSGRFKFLGTERETKKGRLRVGVIKY